MPDKTTDIDVRRARNICFQSFSLGRDLEELLAEWFDPAVFGAIDSSLPEFHRAFRSEICLQYTFTLVTIVEFKNDKNFFSSKTFNHVLNLMGAMMADNAKKTFGLAKPDVPFSDESAHRVALMSLAECRTAFEHFASAIGNGKPNPDRHLINLLAKRLGQEESNEFEEMLKKETKKILNQLSAERPSFEPKARGLVAAAFRLFGTSKRGA